MGIRLSWDFAVDSATIFEMRYGSAGTTAEPGSVDAVDKATDVQRIINPVQPRSSCGAPLFVHVVC